MAGIRMRRDAMRNDSFFIYFTLIFDSVDSNQFAFQKRRDKQYDYQSLKLFCKYLAPKKLGLLFAKSYNNHQGLWERL